MARPTPTTVVRWSDELGRVIDRGHVVGFVVHPANTPDETPLEVWPAAECLAWDFDDFNAGGLGYEFPPAATFDQRVATLKALAARPYSPRCKQGLETTARCFLPNGHDGDHLYHCASPTCPGAPWPPSTTPHHARECTRASETDRDDQ